MKVSYRMHLIRSRPIARIFGNAAADANAQRRDPFELRPTSSSADAGISDGASQTVSLLPRRLLFLPVFIAIVTAVLLFLGISWTIHSGKLLHHRIRALVGAGKL